MNAQLFFSGFSVLGLFIAWYVHNKMPSMKGTRAAEGVLFFFAMEFLQFFQYFWIADNLKDAKCQNLINQALTLAGFLHICLQPYYTHVINAALTPNPDNAAHANRFKGNEAYATKMRYKHAKFSVILNLCLIAGALLFIRCMLAMNGYFNTLDMSKDADISAIKPMQSSQLLTSTEWLRGDRLCTWKGNHHLAWSVPMSDPSYNIMGAGIHSFVMFAPFVAVIDKFNTGAVLMVLQATFLYALGPGMAALVTPNLHEQASIWCLFSMAQIFVMFFVIYRSFNKDKTASSGEGKAAGRSNKLKH